MKEQRYIYFYFVMEGQFTLLFKKSFATYLLYCSNWNIPQICIFRGSRRIVTIPATPSAKRIKSSPPLLLSSFSASRRNPPQHHSGGIRHQHRGSAPPSPPPSPPRHTAVEQEGEKVIKVLKMQWETQPDSQTINSVQKHIQSSVSSTWMPLCDYKYVRFFSVDTKRK